MYMYSKIFSLYQIKVLLIVSSLLISQAFTGEISALIDNRSKQVFKKLHSDPVYKQNRSRLTAYLSTALNDIFHFTYMGQYAAGKFWRKMTKSQRQEYIKQFKILLLNTYGSIILEYRYKDLKIFPEVPARKKKQFWVKVIAERYGQPFSLNYQVAVTKKGPLIINIKADGISLLINYRKSFAEILSSEGADSLIKILQDKNSAS